MMKKLFVLLVIALCLIAVPAVATITQNTTTNGSYTIQTFTSNLGTVTAPANETTTFIIPTGVTQIEYLVVAGGGGGAAGHVGGGAGAGGYLTNYGNATAISAGTTVNIAIGLGGNGGAAGAYTNPASNGGDSVFNNIVAIGGGRGGYYSAGAGQTGGSGGGGAYSGGVGGLASPTGQGNSGGTSGANGGGGGGGANAAGGSAIGYGGNGSVNYIRGIGAQVYAGGGGGGSIVGDPAFIGGSGGGGRGGTNGGSVTSGVNGTNTLGGGGGGGGFTPIYAGGGGGSGIVVIRYLTPASGVTANFTASQLSGVYPFTATFTSDSTGSPITYNWSVNGAVEATTQNYTRLFNNGGNFTVNLTVTATGSTSTASKVITVFNQTNGGFVANVTSGARPLEVLFTDSSSNATSWYYEFGDGNTSTSQSPSFTYNIAGVYSVNQRVTNSANVSWYNRTNYITVSDGLYAITANFTATNQTGEIPLVTTLTDASTYFNSTPATYFWDFDDGTNSTDRNVSHTFSTAGVYHINYTVTNATEGISSSKILPFTATSPTGFNQQDIEMSPSFVLTLHFTDSTTGAPIPVVTVTTSSGQSYTTTNGTAYFTEPYSIVVVYATATGYVGVGSSYVVDSDRTETLSMIPSTDTTSSKLNVLYPREVQFACLDLYSNPLSNMTVTAIMSESPTDATNWISTLFGISSDTTPINTTLMVGITDDEGSVAFPMIASARYRMSFASTEYGVSETRTVSPQQTYFVYMFATTNSIEKPNMADYINGTLYTTEHSATIVNLSMSYIDSGLSTTSLTYYVDYANGTRLHTFSAFGNNNYANRSYMMTNTKAASYAWGYSAYSSTFGWVNESSGIMLKGVTGKVMNLDPCGGYATGWGDSC